MRICISVGHGKSAGGGYDSGAVGGGFHEFRIARKIGFYIAEALKNYGCDTVLINYDADMYLTDRIAYVNRGNFDLAAEIHLNAGGGTGSEVYYKHADEGGKKLAAEISAGIAKTFSLRDRGAKTKLNSAGGDYFGFVRSVRCRSLLIETVFIDSSSDRKNVETEAGQKKCGESIAASIAEFYGLCVKNEPQKVAQYADIRAGDRVKIIGKNYATGQRVPSWVKLRTHTVAKVEPSRALLKEINSWVRLSDLRLAARPSVSVGSVVFIKPGAVYGGCTSARGKRVPDSQLSPKNIPSRKFSRTAARSKPCSAIFRAGSRSAVSRRCDMNAEITVALLSAAGTLIGSLGGILASNRLTNYRIAQLEKRVDKHNNLVERMAAAEDSIKSAHRRIDDITRRK